MDLLQTKLWNISLPKFLHLSWTHVGVKEKKTGGWGIYLPHENFVKNVGSYAQNKFINIGLYPRFLWQFKEYLPELRSQLVFQSHLCRNVRLVAVTFKMFYM